MWGASAIDVVLGQQVVEAIQLAIGEMAQVVRGHGHSDAPRRHVAGHALKAERPENPAQSAGQDTIGADIKFSFASRPERFLALAFGGERRCTAD